MKTAATVLQEMLVKLGQTPEYEIVDQAVPPHLAIFQCRCKARGEFVAANARSKKEAKQEAARLMLLRLAERGEKVPPPYNMPTQSQSSMKPGDGNSDSSTSVPSCVGPHSYVALLKDLCEEYRLPGAEYELVSDTGPPHARRFTMMVRMGKHERYATSTTKKAARQQAAQQLYTYMRENLSRLTKDFVEEEALVRAHERAMERYVEMRDAEQCWRPDLGQRIADYHLGLKTHIDADKLELARKVLETLDVTQSSECSVLESALAAAAAALGLTVAAGALGGERAPLSLVELTPSSPALAFAGADSRAALSAALAYLRLALQQ